MLSADAFGRLKAALADRYRIERELGAGGMATVYLADDLRHGRRVALKVLRPELAAAVGAERFLAEVKTTASLQHPHILPLFDSGQADGFLFYVMPHVRGESLRDRLAREGQLPVEDAVRIASDVAEALDHAHKNGIIHRDIKPANVLLQDGQPVVSDFGIALALGADVGSRLTETGLSLGTPHYMSPEQATGDQRIGPAADVYALGCVLYEMLAGEPPYTGTTPQAILGKIVLGRISPVGEHRPATPPNVAAAVARALEKVPADRFQTAGGLARALADPGFRWPRDTAASPRSRRTIALAGAAGALALAALVLVQGAFRADAPTDAPPPLALSFELPDDQLLALLGIPSSLELSPDGARIAYVAEQGANRRVYVRELASFDPPRPLEGTDGATSLFFSPDGLQIGFYAGGSLRRVAVAGGIPARIANVPSTPVGVSWGDDGTILYALGTRTSSVWRLNLSGGAPAEIPLVVDSAAWVRDKPELPLPANLNVRWPSHLPRADIALVVTGGTIGIAEVSTGRYQPLLRGDHPYYVATGHIVFYSAPEQVSVVPFDLDRLELTGPAVPVANDVLRPVGSDGRFSVARNGTLAYARGGFSRRIELVDRNGRGTPVPVEPRGYRFPAVSPDGRFVAVTVDPQPPETWMIDIQSGRAQPVSTGGYHMQPVWRRDGTRLAFYTNPGMAWIPWPEAGTARQVPVPADSLRGNQLGATDWAFPDRMLVEGNGDVFVRDVATGSLTPWLVTSAAEGLPRTSPDGRWVAYVSDVSGNGEVYVRSYDGAPPEIPVSVGGGTDPVWSTDGSEILYRNGNAVLSVPVRTTPPFEVLASPEVLFSGDYDFSNYRNWDVTPDGRFLMIRSSPGIRREIRVLSGWLR